jgi:hypothetical protein
VDDLRTPEDVADFLATDPKPWQQEQAIDDLIGLLGHDRGLSVWVEGHGLHNQQRQVTA